MRQIVLPGLFLLLCLSAVAVAGDGGAATETWTTAEGFAVEAAFVETRDEVVSLRRPDGQTLKVPLAELAPESRERAAQRAKEDDGTGLRGWTSATGFEVRARFDRLEGNDLYLIREDGTPLQIGLDRISEADQKLALELGGKAAAAGGPAVETGPNKLPVFTSGPWRGYHAVYQHALFDAKMKADGQIVIQLKDGQRALGPPLTLGMACYFVQHARPVTRPVKAFHEPPVPVMQPREITLKGMLREEVPFEVTFTFENHVISGWGWSEDPKGLALPTRFRILARIPPSHSFERQVPQEERVKGVEGYALHVREDVGGRLRRTTYNYHDAMIFRHAVREAEVEAPNWAPRKVSVRAGSTRLPLRPWIYHDRSLWEGYVFQLIKPDSTTRQQAQRIEVHVQ